MWRIQNLPDAIARQPPNPPRASTAAPHLNLNIFKPTLPRNSQATLIPLLKIIISPDPARCAASFLPSPSLSLLFQRQRQAEEEAFATRAWWRRGAAAARFASPRGSPFLGWRGRVGCSRDRLFSVVFPPLPLAVLGRCFCWVRAWIGVGRRCLGADLRRPGRRSRGEPRFCCGP